MVDPKRHINILSEEDQLFLNECEEEFKDRFTEDDAEFQAYCAQPSPPPPVLEPWQNRNHHQGGGGGGGDRRHDGGGGRGRGRFHHYQHNNRNRDYRDRPYNRGDSGHHHGNRYNSNNNRDNNNRYNSCLRTANFHAHDSVDTYPRHTPQQSRNNFDATFWMLRITTPAERDEED